jgi:hypothetical protein
MNQWTIRKRLTAGFGTVVVIAAMLGGFAYVRLTAINHLAASIKDEAVPGVVLFGEIDSLTRESMSVVQKIALNEDRSREAGFESQLADLGQQVEGRFTDYEKTIFQDQDRQLFAAVKGARTTMLEARDRFVVYARTHSAKDSGLEFDR